MTLLLLPKAAVTETGVTFEAVVNWEVTGATLGVSILDNQGATSVARSTSGITEDPAGSGVYRRDVTAPTVEGAYLVVWDDGTDYAVEALYVTPDIADFTYDASTSSAHSLWTAGFGTGLTGTIGVRVLDNQGNATIARTTSGISEAPAGSGIYVAQITTPSTVGYYSAVWDDGTNWAADNFHVGIITTPVPPDVPTTGTLTLTAVSTGTLDLTPDEEQ